VERIEDVFLILRPASGLIRIFDSEDKFSFEMAGKDQVKEGDIGGAYVGIACGGWCNADSNVHKFLLDCPLLWQGREFFARGECAAPLRFI
jgi:hypothetical protein